VGGGVAVPVTFSVALAGVVLVIEVPPPVELNAPAGILLIRFPTVVDVRLIDTVQRPGVVPTCAGTVPPLREKEVAPGFAVTVPPQELETFAELATLSPG
jgi:hypothetical protein